MSSSKRQSRSLAYHRRQTCWRISAPSRSRQKLPWRQYSTSRSVRTYKPASNKRKSSSCLCNKRTVIWMWLCHRARGPRKLTLTRPLVEMHSSRWLLVSRLISNRRAHLKKTHIECTAGRTGTHQRRLTRSKLSLITRAVRRKNHRNKLMWKKIETFKALTLPYSSHEPFLMPHLSLPCLPIASRS